MHVRLFLSGLVSCLGLLVSLSALSQTIPFMPRPVTAMDCAVQPPPPTANLEAVSCFMPRPNTEVWSINHPNVRQAETAYPPIKFVLGDVVSFAAGGCAQTGGSGYTWKRYVNPMTLTRGADSKYYASAYIPGVIDPTAFRDLLRGQPVTITTDPGPEGYLRLRYKDDGYGDNGYWGKGNWWGNDNGLLEQCREMPDAWVVVVIQHGCAQGPSSTCIFDAPVDLVSKISDDNGFMQNPTFGWELLTGMKAPAWQLCGLNYKSVGMPEDDLSLCTRQQVSKDTSSKCPAPLGATGTYGRIEGHVNWAPAVPAISYSGFLSWGGHTQPDDDYTLNLSDNAQSMFIQNNHLEIEFDSEETIDNFSTTWWNDFHSAVDNGKGTAFIGAYEKRAIVIGLPGMDCEHHCNTEIHPVWAMAINVKDDPNEDVWSFFVRNWGNEGYCGTNDHQLTGVPSITFRLPRPNATSVTILSQEFEMNLNFALPTIGMAPGGGAALINFPLPDPSQHPSYDGLIRLKWTSSVPSASGRFLGKRDVTDEEKTTTETRLNDLIEYMTPNQRAIYARASQTERPPVRRVRVPVREVDRAQSERARPRVISLPDPSLDRRRNLKLQAIRQALGDELPPEWRVNPPSRCAPKLTDQRTWCE